MKLQDHRLSARPTERSSRAFFESVLPLVLERNLPAFRRIGGAIGLYVGDVQWLIDLDAGVVRGGDGWPAVEEAPSPSPVVRLDEPSFVALASGRRTTEAPALVSGDLERLRRFLTLLSSC